MNENAEMPLCPEALHYLEEVVGQDPPRPNAFRLLGLSVYDDARMIRRREQMLSMQRFKPLDQSWRGPLPQPGVATARQIAEAAHRLRSPACRLVDELFWFWPDQALPSLAQHPEQVLRHWKDQEDKPSAWQAIHNLAVFYLTKAVDYESQEMTNGEALTDKQSAACMACWKRAIRRWLQLRQQNEMWRQYQIRVEHFNDPRFPGSSIVSTRRALEEILLRGLTALIIQAALSNRRAQLDRCLQLLNQADFHDSLRQSVSRKLLIPLSSEIEVLVESTEGAVRQSPELGTHYGRELIEKTRIMVMLFDTILPKGDMLTCTVCDDLCVALLKFQVQCTKVTNDWGDALALLRAIRPLARSETVQHRVDENIDIVKGNLGGNYLE